MSALRRSLSAVCAPAFRRAAAPRCASAAVAGSRRSSFLGGRPAQRKPRSPDRDEPGQFAVRADRYLPSLTIDPEIDDFGGPIVVSWSPRVGYLRDEGAGLVNSIRPFTVRDSCRCSKCRDPTSGQKKYSSIEISKDIAFKSVRETPTGIGFTFENEIERLADGGHETILSWEVVGQILERKTAQRLKRNQNDIRGRTGCEFWDADILSNKIRKIDYSDYIQGGDAFWDALIDICRYGIVFLKNVPKDENAIVNITTAIANIKETFYGRTFDVRAKPEAENIAYTNGYLGLHQDLLYLQDPPFLQVLHCMENSCEGGDSLFSDGERIGRLFLPHLDSYTMQLLVKTQIPYAYEKNGYNYSVSRPVLSFNKNGRFRFVAWSPPFQAPYERLSRDLRSWVTPARLFDQLINEESAVYRTRLEAGDCVLFDNMRVMHGRTAFDTASGQRWLRGAYIGSQDFHSKASYIPEERVDANGGRAHWTSKGAQSELELTDWHADVSKRVQELETSAAGKLPQISKYKHAGDGPSKKREDVPWLSR